MTRQVSQAEYVLIGSTLRIGGVIASLWIAYELMLSYSLFVNPLHFLEAWKHDPVSVGQLVLIFGATLSPPVLLALLAPSLGARFVRYQTPPIVCPSCHYPARSSNDGCSECGMRFRGLLGIGPERLLRNAARQQGLSVSLSLVAGAVFACAAVSFSAWTLTNLFVGERVWYFTSGLMYPGLLGTYYYSWIDFSHTWTFAGAYVIAAFLCFRGLASPKWIAARGRSRARVTPLFVASVVLGMLSALLIAEGIGHVAWGLTRIVDHFHKGHGIHLDLLITGAILLTVGIALRASSRFVSHFLVAR